MEDVDDPTDKVRLPGLSSLEDGLLMTEDEFQNCPKVGGTGMKLKQKRNQYQQQSGNELPQNARPAVNMTHKSRKTQKDAGKETEYCEPTSSKIKVEDLVKDDKDKDEAPLLPPKPITGTRSFWDRPTPPPELDWYYDPCMPDEWNELVYSMNAYRWRHYSTPTVNIFTKAHPEDVSEPMEFIRTMNTHTAKANLPPLRLNVPDQSELSLLKLKKRYDELRQPKPPQIPHEQSRAQAPDKGKAKQSTDGKLDQDYIPRLQQQWADEFHDMVQGTPDKLPPFRKVNHEIHLIDENKRYTYHLPRCPNVLREQWHEKLNRYVNAGWWEPCSMSQAAPMMCIPKKDGRLRTVVDARQRNDNTIKDVTPLPDQELIREDVARARYRSKINLADAYEQVRIRSEDVYKTAFATISGTYVSNVVQQGDCNAPATFQRLMTSIF